MTIFEEQFETLKSANPEASFVDLSGQYVITVPGLALPPGWSRQTVDVKFVAPVGYPFSQPDCFWTNPDLRLVGGQAPQNTGNTACPDQTQQLWFSWHVAKWLPNSDSLVTYLNVIKDRFKKPV